MATEGRSFSWTRSDSARRVAAEEADARQRVAGTRRMALAAGLLVPLHGWVWRLLGGWHLVVLGVLVLAWLPPPARGRLRGGAVPAGGRLAVSSPRAG